MGLWHATGYLQDSEFFDAGSGDERPWRCCDDPEDQFQLEKGEAGSRSSVLLYWQINRWAHEEEKQRAGRDMRSLEVVKAIDSIRVEPLQGGLGRPERP